MGCTGCVSRTVRYGNHNVRAQNHITNCSRGIHNAWHFHYALILVIKVVYGNIGIALLTP
ncbi:DUF3265 domain-containing protein [Vibrio alginolyticus]|nr:DUF3265 domain-containing protein [Vibrio alginolyticus]MCG9744714.1 DUF3265 domain-containing protein [Vibrio alginolyticus]